MSLIEPCEKVVGLKAGSCRVQFSARNGGISSIAVDPDGDAIATAGALWVARFDDGARLDASMFDADGGTYRFIWQAVDDGKLLSMTYDCPRLMVSVTAAATPDGIELVGQVTPRGVTVLEFALPGRLTFDPQQLDRLIFPTSGLYAVGAAFKRSFFEPRPEGASFRCEANYPPAVIDLYHLTTAAGMLAVYRVQPRTWRPWQAMSDPAAITYAGRLACGREDEAGYCDRYYQTHVADGQSWTAPVTRITVGNDVFADVRQYCRANGITRRLDDKLPEVMRESFKQSVLVYYLGTCAELEAHLDALPVPTQVHYSSYLKGGFDKQYPDHLPPRADFGTPDDLRTFIDHCRQRGHLLSPYTNPTWWCIGPKGPTFEKAGDAPLQRKLNGDAYHEDYHGREGYAICFWHEAVRAANRRTLRQFTQEYPSDIYFVDQCGARGYGYDTNPASPTPCAYLEGLLSMLEEDCQVVPMSTEGGWDHVFEPHIQCCGMTWSIAPSAGGPPRLIFNDAYPPDGWEVFPLLQCAGHDKVAFTYHDLGQPVDTPLRLTWALGLGFCLNMRINATDLARPSRRQWLAWLDRVQKSVCARYVGQGVTAFKHDRGPKPQREDMGVFRATYGPVQIIANVGSQRRTHETISVAAHGFLAIAPGLTAGMLAAADDPEAGASFVAEYNADSGDLWVFAPPGTKIAVLLPPEMPEALNITWDQGTSAVVAVHEHVVQVACPAGPAEDDEGGPVSQLWHATLRPR